MWVQLKAVQIQRIVFLNMLNKPRIDLNWLFEGLDNYCIIKISELFPYYEKNSDLDIICDDKIKFSKILNEKITNKYKLKTKSYIAANNNLQLDVIINNTLDIKFDLTDDLTCFSVIPVDKKLVDDILYHKQTHFNTFIPCIDHEFIIRYLEYNEYKSNPSKIKHLNYINNNGSSVDNILKLLQPYT